jgi:hypothetical protein
VTRKTGWSDSSTKLTHPSALSEAGRMRSGTRGGPSQSPPGKTSVVSRASIGPPTRRVCLSTSSLSLYSMEKISGSMASSAAFSERLTTLLAPIVGNKFSTKVLKSRKSMTMRPSQVIPKASIRFQSSLWIKQRSCRIAPKIKERSRISIWKNIKKPVTRLTKRKPRLKKQLVTLKRTSKLLLRALFLALPRARTSLVQRTRNFNLASIVR